MRGMKFFWLVILILVVSVSSKSVLADNIAKIRQVGSDNIAVIKQGGDADNIAKIKQDGSDNIAVIKQSGDANYAWVSQNGNWNDTDLSGFFYGHDWECQFDTLGFLQYQDGVRNKAYLEIEGEDNHISQWQEGERNFLQLFVEGNSNAIKQVQLGDFNESVVEITGSYNTLCNYQEGNNLYYFITITGTWPEPICVIQQ